ASRRYRSHDTGISSLAASDASAFPAGLSAMQAIGRIGRRATVEARLKTDQDHAGRHRGSVEETTPTTNTVGCDPQGTASSFATWRRRGVSARRPVDFSASAKGEW